jgi:ABC-2 type transport system permease protein
MSPALRFEWLKMRRSPVTATATLLMTLFLPVMGLAFYLVAVNGGNGALAGKAGALLSAEGWEGYLSLVSQIAAVAVFLGAGVVVAWVFGREHTERTFPALFARPTSMGHIATAKLLVACGWIVVLTVMLCLMTLLYGLLADVATSGPLNWADAARLVVVTLAAGTLGLTMGYVASIGRGYLPAIGAIIVIIAVAQVAVLFGTGAWFPFAVPGLLAVSGTEGVVSPNTLQLLLVPTIALAAAWLTVNWWRNSEVV